MYLGVDEAGKGPVLGPMVAAAVRAAPERLPDDVDDSKRVAPARREEIAATLRERDDVSVGVVTVEPAEIDDPETDMNTLTVLAQARAVRAALEEDAAGADEGVRVVADAGDVSESRFADRLADAVTDPDGWEPEGQPPAVSVTAEHGADESDPVVGAASVVAKVVRDERVAAIDDAHPDHDVGSGYPSDRTTREFLEAYAAAHGDVPDCARRSWSTCADVLATVEQSGLDDF